MQDYKVVPEMLEFQLLEKWDNLIHIILFLEYTK